ncbi:MAG TPA: 1-acyl-sn-glycerol-3-phosphate acyltransferase [Bacteroidales bacterium]|nr:1-acyl-sn-glycerol-3-phosphate acyltransferase [Bacteroidales bacterium]
MEDSEKFLDVEGVIGKKNPRLLKVIPGFVIRYLKKVLHQDDLNDIIHNNRDRYGVDFVDGSLEGFGSKFEAVGLENVPSSGRFIFASNHPLGGLDGLIFMSVVRKRFPHLKFIVNDLLLNVKNLEPVFIPVNKHGKQSVSYVAAIDKAYASDEQILYFPAGLCSRKINGQITDLPWHKSFITKAIKYQRDVIPVYFEGRNSNFFYNLSNFRKTLGIKANIEMFYLVDEMFKQHKKFIRLYFGKPIPYSTFDHSKTPAEWANYVRSEAYALSTKLK